MTPKQLKGMRIAAIIQGILTIAFMILFFRSKFKNDDLNYELIIQENISEATIEELQTKVDSLTSELNRLRQDTIPNMPLDSPH